MHVVVSGYRWGGDGETSCTWAKILVRSNKLVSGKLHVVDGAKFFIFNFGGRSHHR